MTERILWGSLIAGAALSWAVCVGIATHTWTVGSVDGGWVYPYVQVFAWRMLIPAAFAALVAAALLWLPAAPGRRTWPLLVAWLLAATAFQAALRPVAPFSLESIVRSPGAHAFYTVTEQHGAGDVLRHFNRIRAQAPLHAQSNMPGKIMLVYALKVFSSDTSVLPWLIVFVSNLGAVLMYLLVREMFDDRQVALFAAVLYLFVPSRIAFLPLMNTVTPVVVLLCAWLLLRWLRCGRMLDAVLMGTALYALVFFEPLPLVIGLLFGGFVFGATARGQTTWARFIPQAAVMALTVIAISEAVYAVFGFELVSTFRRLGEHAAEFNALKQRPYGVWVGANLVEFASAVGLCQAVLFFGTTIVALRGDASWRERLARPLTVVCAGLAAVLVATDLIGLNRGEVTRLWIFLACLFQIPAAYACATLDHKAAPLIVIGTTVLHTALSVAMIGFVVP